MTTMFRPRHGQFAAGFLLGLCGLSLLGAGDVQKRGVSAALQAVLNCRVASDPTPRLACFDDSVAKLAQAEASGQIVVVDREQVRAVRREAFGFNLPKLSIFDRGEKPDQIDRVSLAVESAHQNGDGKWIITVEGGGVWRQTDAERLAPPEKDAKAEIRKAALGSYFMSIDGRRSIRVERVR
jgi:hypothetical protein